MRMIVIAAIAALAACAAPPPPPRFNVIDEVTPKNPPPMHVENGWLRNGP